MGVAMCVVSVFRCAACGLQWFIDTNHPTIGRAPLRRNGKSAWLSGPWTAEGFAESAKTDCRLPPVRLQGHFNLWPGYPAPAVGKMGASDIDPRPLLSSSAAIERMLETMGWVLWLSVEERIGSGCGPRRAGGGSLPGASGATGPRHGGSAGERLKQSRAI